MRLITLAVALQTPADMSKGAHLYSSCQAAVRLAESPSSAQAKTELPTSTYCFGYLGGYVDGVNRLGNSICVNSASMDTVALVYVAYMQRTPKLMDEERSLGVQLSLASAYSCPPR